jgi:hypothetical protein
VRKTIAMDKLMKRRVKYCGRIIECVVDIRYVNLLFDDLGRENGEAISVWGHVALSRTMIIG